MSTITQEMSIPEIVAAHPQTETVFRRFGIQVAGYQAIEHEDLSATCRVHQLVLADVLAALNAAVQ